MATPFAIGDTVFMGRYDRVETHIPCPDCFGKKTLTVILGDDSQVVIRCAGCKGSICDEPVGIVKQYEFQSTASQHVVTGIDIDAKGVREYRLDEPSDKPSCYSYRTARPNEIFATKAEAIAFADMRRLDHEADENKRLLGKTNSHRDWAWHVRYHRECARKAEKDLAYHTKMVSISTEKHRGKP